jgi:tripartite-type tricarboxylate transporter receptor subunit TctC
MASVLAWWQMPYYGAAPVASPGMEDASAMPDIHCVSSPSNLAKSLTMMIQERNIAKPRPASRRFMTLVLAGAMFAPAAYAAFPDKPVHLILSFPPAGATDILARGIGQKIAEAIGQPVIVENRPGAGGNIGLIAAARAPADGYTIYLGAVTNAAIAAAAYSPQPAHLIKDFTPLAGVATVPHILVVPASSSATTVSELVAMLKSSPGKYNFASQGAGTLSHLESELFKIKTGADVLHVPYKGSSQALPDLMAGTSAMMFDSIPASMPQVKSGRLKVLAVASGKRVSSLPDVPTVQEAGVAGFEANNLFGFLVPKGTPPEAVKVLSGAIETALAAPGLRQTMEAQGVELKFTPAAEFGKMVGQEFATWRQVVETAKVKLD